MPAARQTSARSTRIGEGVTTDYAEAMHWFQLAAAQGDATGQSWIGYLYANGDGVAEDMGQARFWYSKAAANGDATPRPGSKSIAKGEGVSSGEIRSGRR